MSGVKRCILGSESEIIKVLPSKDRGTIYMNPKYIQGENLERYINDNENLNEKMIFNILSQMCNIMKCLQDLNLSIEYKELKPSKIIITPNGKVILVDVGVSKFNNINENTNRAIENIGKILYYMVKRTFPITTLQPNIEMHYDNNINNNFKNIIKKCFNFDVKNRYISIEQLNREVIVEMIKINKYKYRNETMENEYNIKCDNELITRKELRKSNRFKFKRNIENILDNTMFNVRKVYKAMS